MSVGLPGESLPSSSAAPGYVVTGVAVCDEPESEMLDLILAKLVDYDVEVGSSGQATQITVRPVA